MPTDSDRRALWRNEGEQADATASMLENRWARFWRHYGNSELTWGVVFEVIRLRRFAAWTRTL